MTSDDLVERERAFHPDNHLPDCMMPDGGECCAGHAAVCKDWHKQRREIERLRIHLNALQGDLAESERIADDFGKVTPQQYQKEIERLRNQLAALPDDKRASDDVRKAAIEECAQIADYQAKILNNTEIQRAHIYSATCIAKAIRALASREPRPAGAENN